MIAEPLQRPLAETTSEGGAPREATERAVEARTRALHEAHFEVVWRTLRRLGVPEAETDDAVQQVFLVASGKLDAIRPGSERGFLLGTSIRVASHVRRTLKRRAEVPDDFGDRPDLTSNPEALVEQRRAREMLDAVLEKLSQKERAVFVLFELEEMTVAEIATVVGVPEGTAASRLRRAREHFDAEIARVVARTPRRRPR